jgi:hypothetical protein
MIITDLNSIPVMDLEIFCNVLKVELQINDGKIVGTEGREV